MTFARTPMQLAILAALSGLAHAGDLPLAAPESAAPSHDISTVTVVGKQPSSLPVSIPTTSEGIDHAEIERSINAHDAEDALKYLPSLLVRKRYIGDYNHAVLSTRASGTGNSARSMVYADGILLSNYLGNGASFAPRWGMVNPEQIERVDVLYGPFSAAYGGNSVGAVVDYVTRMPTHFEAHARLSLSRQSFKLYRSDGKYDATQGSVAFGNRVGRWSWTIDASHTDSDGQPLTFPTKALAAGKPGPGGVPVTGAVAGFDRANNPWYILGTATAYHTKQDNFKARVAYDITPEIRATYTFGLWRNDAEGRPDSYLRDPSGRPVYSGAFNIDGRSYMVGPTDFSASNEIMRHVMHGLSVKKHSRGLFDWELSTSRYDYATDELRAPTVAFPGALGGGAGRIVDGHGTGWRTYAAKGIWRPQGPAGAHVFEFGYQRETYRLSSVENRTGDWVDGSPGALNLAFSGRTSIDSMYAQDTWRFAPKWKAVLGLRYERWHARDGRTANATSTILQGERNDSRLSPKAALSFHASEDWTLKASLGRAVRFPTVSELYQGGINAAGVLTNNDPTLRPEQSWTGELTAERRLASGTWRLTAFGERTEDALYSQTNVLVTPMVTNIQNVDRIATRGFETAYSAENVFLPGLSLASSLTWTRSRIERNDKFPSSVGKWQPRIPEWRASGVATYAFNDRLDVTLAARYSGRQYSTLDNSDPNGFAYQGASRYFTVDLRALYRIDKRWSVALGIDNLNNDKYWNFHPYPQRTLTAELRFDL